MPHGALIQLTITIHPHAKIISPTRYFFIYTLFHIQCVYEACKSTSPHFKSAMLIIKLIKSEANVREEWQCKPISHQISCLFLEQFVEFLQLIMQMAKLKCGEVLPYASYLDRAINHIFAQRTTPVNEHRLGPSARPFAGIKDAWDCLYQYYF